MNYHSNKKILNKANSASKKRKLLLIDQWQTLSEFYSESYIFDNSSIEITKRNNKFVLRLEQTCEIGQEINQSKMGGGISGGDILHIYK